MKIELLPISLGVTREKAFKAIPYPADEKEAEMIYRALARLSGEFGTRLEQKDDVILVKLQ